MTIESWRTPEAAAAAAEKQRKQDEWSAQAARERAELLRAEAAEDVGKLHVRGDGPADRVALRDDAPSIDLSQAPTFRQGKTLDDVAFPWSRWTEEKCEETLLGWIYRQRHSEGDRRSRGSGIDQVEVQAGNLTGVPSSEAKLAPRGARMSGIETAMASTIFPDKIAALCILRDDDMLSRADGTAGASLWNIKNDRHPWREDEEIVHGELSFRFKKLFLRWSERGLLKLQPAVKWNAADTSGLGRDGLPDQCTITIKAVELAEERIRGTDLARGPGNPLGTKTQAQRDAVAQHAPWYMREFKDGAKAGT